MIDLAKLWPQDWISDDCFVTIAMDLTAPFLCDIGLAPEAQPVLRRLCRQRIDEDPGFLSVRAEDKDKVAWLYHFDELAQQRLSAALREQFWAWVKDTYTYAPADRPNWERYENYFFQWSVSMRRGVDNAGCFNEPKTVFETFVAFTSLRHLKERIKHATGRQLSEWDARVFSLCNYTFDEDDISGKYSSPLAVVTATSERNYFQQFWEYLYPLLTPGEVGRLYEAILDHYGHTSFLKTLVHPSQLNRGVR